MVHGFIANTWSIISVIMQASGKDLSAMRIRLSFTAGTIGLILFISIETMAATYYVAPTGNNSNPGTESSPWATIQKAANMATAGDTVLIRQGVYAERVSPTNSGTEGNYITYRNYGSEAVVIDAAHTRDSCISVSAKSYLQFIGLELQGATNAGLLVSDNSSYIIADGLKSHNNRFGIRFTGSTNPVNHCIIRNCATTYNTSCGIFLYKKIYNTVVGPNNDSSYNSDGTTSEDSYGLDIVTDFPGTQADGAQHIEVYDNEFHHNEEQGMRTWNAAYVWIHDNYCHHNGATGIQLEDGTQYAVIENNRSEYNAQTWEFETGAWVDGTTNATIRNNIFRGNKIGFMVSSSTRVLVRNNLIYENNRGVPDLANCRGLNIYGNSVDVTVAHNTLYRNGAPQSGRGSVAIYNLSSIVAFRNNILAESTAPIDLQVAQDFLSNHNIVYNTRTPSISWKGSTMSWNSYKASSGQDANSIASSPQFTSPSTEDFHPAAGSPAIDAGEILAHATSAGTGTTIVVDVVRYFSDGYGIAPGDLVQVGTNAPVRLVAVDLSNKTLTVDKDIRWGSGDGVSYPFTGSLPDIGAYEYNSTDVLQAPSGLRVVAP
jgi:parallel beta-helix repeat protein